MFPSMALHTRSDSVQTRQQILQAACSVAIHGGPQALTIDGVAREAGMSKGGVLYHFPSKESLMKGLLKLHQSCAWQGMHLHWKADPRTEGRWHRAWIKANFDGLRRSGDMENASLFATVTSTPELLAFLQRQFRRIQWCLDFDGLDPLWSRMLISSVAGLRYDRLFRFCWVEQDSLDGLERKTLEMLEQILRQGDLTQVPPRTST